MTNYDKVQMMLNSYIIWVNNIKNIELEIEALINNYDLSGIELKEKTGQTFKITNEIEDRITSKDEKIEQYKHLKRINEINVEKINNAANILGEFEANVIELKYLTSSTETWKNISSSLNASISACRQARVRAINKMIPLLCH